MLIWRLVKPEHAPGLDGEGARVWGGRWNSRGVAMVYCASSLALAAFEVFVHLPPAMRRAGALPALLAVGLEIPDVAVSAMGDLSLDQNGCRNLGDDWVARKSSCAIRVPSFVIPLETNILLNPRHGEMSQTRMVIQEPFQFDDRLTL